jgi:hypothetical protein
MTEAIFGLIGVIIGGLLNGGVTYLTAKKQRQTEALIGARLIHSEIESNQLATQLSLEAKTWDHFRFGIKIDDWLTHREALAGVLNDVDWSALDDYYASARTSAQLKSFDAPSKPPGDRELENFRLMFENGETAASAILAYASSPR